MGFFFSFLYFPWLTPSFIYTVSIQIPLSLYLKGQSLEVNVLQIQLYGSFVKVGISDVSWRVLRALDHVLKEATSSVSKIRLFEFISPASARLHAESFLKSHMDSETHRFFCKPFPLPGWLQMNGWSPQPQGRGVSWRPWSYFSRGWKPILSKTEQKREGMHIALVLPSCWRQLHLLCLRTPMGSSRVRWLDITISRKHCRTEVAGSVLESRGSCLHSCLSANTSPVLNFCLAFIIQLAALNNHNFHPSYTGFKHLEALVLQLDADMPLLGLIWSIKTQSTSGCLWRRSSAQ